MAEESIFRKKSLDRLNTPEELRDYVKVTGIGLWVFLGAVIVLLIGVFVWGCFGHLDTTVTTGAQVKSGKIYCYISESDYENITDDSVIRINETEYRIDTGNITPVELDDTFDSYLVHLCNMENGSWAYELQGDCTLEDGVYEAEVVLDSVSPISLIVN